MPEESFTDVLAEKKYLIEHIKFLNAYNALMKQYSPKIQLINKSLSKLLKDTIELKKQLQEPQYLIQMQETGELVICRHSELKKVSNYVSE